MPPIALPLIVHSISEKVQKRKDIPDLGWVFKNK